jgi:hypothetical protein
MGWAPLVHFLELPFPQDEFPYFDGVKFEAVAKAAISDILGFIG